MKMTSGSIPVARLPAAPVFVCLFLCCVRGVISGAVSSTPLPVYFVCIFVNLCKKAKKAFVHRSPLSPDTPALLRRARGRRRRRGEGGDWVKSVRFLLQDAHSHTSHNHTLLLPLNIRKPHLFGWWPLVLRHESDCD